MNHVGEQRKQSNRLYKGGPRAHVTSTDPLVQYITRWRLGEAFRRLMLKAGTRIGPESHVLVLCAGEGLEGTVIADMGYRRVTVSDISEEGVRAALSRDPRLKGMVRDRSEERRVGKECRSRWSPYR